MKLLQALLYQPERLWRWMLARLWYDRLSLQYEMGYAHGLREATSEAFQTAWKSMTPAEREELLADPEYTQWGDRDE